jgi:hypothetical protein
MGPMLLALFGILFIIMILSNPKILVTTLITGAVGYVIGDHFSEAWSIYGIVLGVAIGWMFSYSGFKSRSFK